MFYSPERFRYKLEENNNSYNLLRAIKVFNKWWEYVENRWGIYRYLEDDYSSNSEVMVQLKQNEEKVNENVIDKVFHITDKKSYKY